MVPFLKIGACQMYYYVFEGNFCSVVYLSISDVPTYQCHMQKTLQTAWNQISPTDATVFDASTSVKIVLVPPTCTTVVRCLANSEAFQGSIIIYSVQMCCQVPPNVSYNLTLKAPRKKNAPENVVC